MSTPKTSTYTITTTDGRRAPALDETYDTPSDAAEAIREMMGWEEVSITEPFAVSEDVDAYAAYPSDETRDADADGAYAPRIVETRGGRVQ